MKPPIVLVCFDTSVINLRCFFGLEISVNWGITILCLFFGKLVINKIHLTLLVSCVVLGLNLISNWVDLADGWSQPLMKEDLFNVEDTLLNGFHCAVI